MFLVNVCTGRQPWASRFALWITLVCLLAGCLPASALAEKTNKVKPTPAPTSTPPPVGEEVPEAIANMIRIAQEEIAVTNKEKIPKSNKYSQWYFNDKRKIGWCSNFVSWCADQAGIDLLKDVDSQPVADEVIFVTNEAKVVLTQSAYRKAERFTDIPRQGYEIIYGVVGGTSSTHVGLVESVIDFGDGVYEITTLEGNVSDTVKRYCMRYILNPKQKHKNMRTVPKNEQTRTDAQYKLQKSDWFITGFGQTWKQ